MNKKPSAVLQKDFYKAGHKNQYPVGTEFVYSNLTARSGKWANIPNSKGVWLFGLQFFIKDFLQLEFDETFFKRDHDQVVFEYSRRMTNAGLEMDVSHISSLHKLGYLPIEIKSLPEGSFVPYGVPFLTIKNTLPEFYWLTNMLETVMSCELWQPITSATTYMWYRQNALKYSELTCDDNSFVRFSLHDFSMRGQSGRDNAAISGAASLAMGSVGTDTITAIDLLESYYGADSDKELVGCSVFATEHSCEVSSIIAFTQSPEFVEYKERLFGDEEYDDKLVAECWYFEQLITNIKPEGICSIVSDSFDFWGVVSEILPRLKDKILQRNGKVVIRPDSSDPVLVVCGDPDADLNSPENKGLIECLWDTFGGTINSKGYKELDSHIGAIYGDSITPDRHDRILKGLSDKGFASNNIVFGIGSVSYNYCTRDSHEWLLRQRILK